MAAAHMENKDKQATRHWDKRLQHTWRITTKADTVINGYRTYT